MATAQPLLAVDGQPAEAEYKRYAQKMSLLYNADDYAAKVSKMTYPELAEMTQPDDDKPSDVVSEKTGRRFPTPNKPDPMPKHLSFMFTKISPEQAMYMWNIFTLLFVSQCAWVVMYALVLIRFLPFWAATLIFGPVFMELMVQNVYILHDVIHGATFPPYSWQKFITHPFAGLFSIPWEDVIMEHNRHHASTHDLLQHGEFGWDPADLVFALQEYSWPTALLVPFWHFLGASDTGEMFALYWYSNWPDPAPGGKCNTGFWKTWFPRRLFHTLFVGALWTCVWLLGTYPMGRDLREGWRLMLPVYCFAKAGFAITWTIFTNFNHSHVWNEFLAGDPERTYPCLSLIMKMVLGGRHRFNEMLFHDVHHAFPNAVGAMSQRGRFHGWEKVHEAAAEILANGLFKPGSFDDMTEKPKMQDIQSRRVSMMKVDC